MLMFLFNDVRKLKLPDHINSEELEADMEIVDSYADNFFKRYNL